MFSNQFINGKWRLNGSPTFCKNINNGCIDEPNTCYDKNYNSTKSKNRKKGHIAVVGAGAFGGWTAYHLLRKCIYEKIVFYNNYKVCPEFSRIIH